MRFLVLAALSFLLVTIGCGDEEPVSLRVALLTDYQPLRDIKEVRVTIDGDEELTQIYDVALDDNFLVIEEPIVSYEGLPASATRSINVPLT